MSFIVTEGSTIDFPTGIPVPTGNTLTTESGVYICTTPIGEAPGGLNSEPGTDSNVPSGWEVLQTQSAQTILVLAPDTPLNVVQILGVPYGFSAPVYIGPLV